MNDLQSSWKLVDIFQYLCFEDISIIRFASYKMNLQTDIVIFHWFIGKVKILQRIWRMLCRHNLVKLNGKNNYLNEHARILNVYFWKKKCTKTTFILPIYVGDFLKYDIFWIFRAYWSLKSACWLPRWRNELWVRYHIRVISVQITTQ